MEGELPLPSVMPGRKGMVRLSDVIWEQLSTCETILTVSFKLAKTSAWADQGHEIGWFQQHLHPPCNIPLTPPASFSAPCIRQMHSTLTIITAQSTFTFSRARGSLTSWTTPRGQIISDSTAHTANNLTPCFWRPPTDNDVPKALPHWRSFGVDRITSQLRSLVLCEKTPLGTVTLTTKTYLAPPSLGWGWHATTTYEIQPDGSAISVFVELDDPLGHKVPEYLPRLGVNLSIAKALNQVTWSGRGPGESYPDKKNSQRIGVWHVDDVSVLQTPYEVPQENGNRTDTRWVGLASAQAGLKVRVTRKDEVKKTSTSLKAPLFNFTATRHSATTIEQAAHPCDLVEDPFTTLRLDVAVSGVGSAACGPGPRDDQLVRPVGTSFGFMLALV